MKKIFICSVLLLLVGCEKNYTDRTNRYALPPDLNDCKIYNLSNGLSDLKVVRCLNSSTSATYMNGKVEQSVVTIDGVKYIKEETK